MTISKDKRKFRNLHLKHQFGANLSLYGRKWSFMSSTKQLSDRALVLPLECHKRPPMALNQMCIVSISISGTPRITGPTLVCRVIYCQDIIFHPLTTKVINTARKTTPFILAEKEAKWSSEPHSKSIRKAKLHFLHDLFELNRFVSVVVWVVWGCT